MNDPIITARDLSVKYAKRTVWKEANFNINKGEFVALLGPNGAGKSTLFKLLLGLVEQDKGSLELFGEQPRKNSNSIGYVPQRRGIDQEANFDVFDFVKLGINGHKLGFSLNPKKDNSKTTEALKLVDGLKLKDKSIGELSGGELQRIFLAQSLVGDPKILLLDEPLSNLDIKRENELVKLIKDLAVKKNITVILIAHDLNPLVGLVDNIIYVANSKIVSGSVEEIITSDNLSKLYGSEIEVMKDSKGRLVILGDRGVEHHHV